MTSYYKKRLLGSLMISLIIMLGLYAFHVGKQISSSAEMNRSSNTAMIRLKPVSNEEYQSSGMTYSAANCPRQKPQRSTLGKPVWMAGYPGSGFDLIAPLTAAVTGMTAVDIYRQHTCLKPVEGTDIPISVCMTHWPLVQKDSPTSVAVSDGLLYQNQAIFVIRNPSYAIPSYHTRWWGAQQHVRSNHAQPPESLWQEWRDTRLEHHLTTWQRSLMEWQRGIPSAGVTGVGLYLPFEELVHPDSGPALTAALANYLEEARHEVASHTSCLWRRIVQDDWHETTAKKEYTFKYKSSQKDRFLQILDELIRIYSITEPALGKILKGYAQDIRENLPLENEEV